MDHSTKVGVSFGLNSGVITTLGMVVGMYTGTHSRLSVIGGIIIIAIADAFSDSLGIHVSEESEGIHSLSEIWTSTIATFLSKFLVATSFIFPVLLLPLRSAVVTSIVWGLLLVALFSYYVTGGGEKQRGAVIEHVSIAVLVIITTWFVGGIVSKIFK